MIDGMLQKCLSFDDVLLVPKKSDISSRSEISIGSHLGDYRLPLPIISSPMDTVTEGDMATAMASAGGLGIIHRYNTISEQAKMIGAALKDTSKVAAAIGVSSDSMERASAIVSTGAKIVCIDVAHGHHVNVERAIKSIKDKFGSDVVIIAGNVATPEGFTDLEDWGADAIRIGIGGGSICSTRIQTGHGVSTFQSVIACNFVRRKAKIIADGGIKRAGDIVKSIAAGADFVMLGSLLAGTEESPGEMIIDGERRRKVYRGMASKEAQVDWRGEVRSFEGISSSVPYSGPVSEVLKELERNVRSGFSYSGARDQESLKKKATFIQQTAASQTESSTHVLAR